MQRRVRTVFTALTLIAASSLALAGPQFKSFASKAGAFSVLMPGTPQQQTKVVDSPAGKLHVHLFVVPLDGGNTAYMASYIDYDPQLIAAAPADKLLDGARDGQVSSVKGKLASEKRLKLGRHPGRELRITLKQGMFIRSRLYLVGNRLYQCLVVGKKAVVNSADAGRFFGSFKTTKK